MIAVLGAGFLGTRFAEEIEGARLLRVDIADRAAVAAAIRESGCTAVINAAGVTGKPNVDWCESHQQETYRGNVIGALYAAEAAAAVGAHFLHLASGCIFYGPSPSPGGWREDDFANPTAFYSRTKYAADLLLSPLPNVAIARLRMPIDDRPGPRNLISKLAAYKQVIDVENSVTFVDDLIHVVTELSKKRATGIFHVTNPGTMRHRDLLSLYKELVDPSHVVELIGEQDLVRLGLATKARSNCVLQSSRLAEIGVTMRPVDVALRDTMTKYARAKKSA